jgi:hypothetical protein
LDKCCRDDIDAKAPGKRPPPQNTPKVGHHSSEGMSCKLPKFTVWCLLVSQHLSADQLAQMRITEDPEWIAKATISDELITAEDLAAVRRLKVESTAYEADNETEGADNEGVDD